MLSEMPRPSRSSAISAADRVVVPRSITRAEQMRRAGASGGSQTEPARTARLIDTAGVFLRLRGR